MPPRPQTYVAFVFSPAFILESKGKEKDLFEEEKVTTLAPGTLARVLEQNREVGVDSRDLSALKVPRGALYFWFYDRLTITARWKSRMVKMKSDPIDESGRCYMDNEGDFFHRAGLESGVDKRIPPEWRKDLLNLMDEKDSNRIIQVQTGGGWDVQQNFVLGPNDILVSPSQVQVFDTDIPWPSK